MCLFVSYECWDEQCGKAAELRYKCAQGVGAFDYAACHVGVQGERGFGAERVGGERYVVYLKAFASAVEPAYVEHFCRAGDVVDAAGRSVDIGFCGEAVAGFLVGEAEGVEVYAVGKGCHAEVVEAVGVVVVCVGEQLGVRVVSGNVGFEAFAFHELGVEGDVRVGVAFVCQFRYFCFDGCVGVFSSCVRCFYRCRDGAKLFKPGNDACVDAA